jgi:hypothetical protein
MPILTISREQRENMKTIDYFGADKVSFMGFKNFCKKNIPLLGAVTFALFFAYGIKLVFYSIGSDTELFMADRFLQMEHDVKLYRFGLKLLSIWSINEYNPIISFFIAFCFIWLFSLSWCYIIAVFSKNTGRNNKLIPFALLFMTMPVWAEQFYFAFQAVETSLMILLCPYVIYLLYKGFLDNRTKDVLCGFILLVLMLSVYQAMVPLFCAGVFACFVLLRENSNYEPGTYRLLCLRLFIALIAALAVYFFLAYIFAVFIFKVERISMFTRHSVFIRDSLKHGVMRILLYGYLITVGHISPIRAFVEPIMVQFARSGVRGASHMSDMSRMIGNIFLLPTVICFIIHIAKTVKKKMVAGNGLLYMLAGIGIPLSIMFLPIMTGNVPPVRSMFSLPFAWAFMVFYLIGKCKKTAASVITCIALCISFYQAQITAQLFYSDYRRYQADVQLSLELDRRIFQIQNDDRNLPIAFVGIYEPQFKTNFLRGNALGKSCFAFPDQFDPLGNPSQRSLAFMKSLGINYDAPNQNQINSAIEAAAAMPGWPSAGSIQCLEDVIVVKLSDPVADTRSE